MEHECECDWLKRGNTGSILLKVDPFGSIGIQIQFIYWRSLVPVLVFALSRLGRRVILMLHGLRA